MSAFVGWKRHSRRRRQLKNRIAEGTHLGNLGGVYFILGDSGRAIEYQELALKVDRDVGNMQGEARALGNLGNAYGVLGKFR
ncbi:MAG: photosystem assembly protein Ycf3 [Acidobacteriaceae bacterium]|jgi:hypothetical protein|nr:photosystem assembly protein Ycf3 [Acidobacteriaceae bacterium]